MLPAKVPKLNPTMTEKTPVSLLQELTISEDAPPPFFDFVANDEDPKAFSCMVEAFGQSEYGAGRSKKEAKHAASAMLIARLQRDIRYRDKLPLVLSAPKPTNDGDAVGRLLDICVQRDWPLAQFQVMQASGEPHRPEFKVICNLATIKRTGRHSTKKGAKQMAALAMLEVVQNFPENEARQQLARVDVETSEKLFRTYCELRKNDITKYRPIRLSNRNRYLREFPADQHQEAYNILMRDAINTPRNKVDLLCKALKLDYTYKDVPNLPTYQTFMLQGEHECVLIEPKEGLSERVLDYFTIMMGLKLVC